MSAEVVLRAPGLAADRRRLITRAALAALADQGLSQGRLSIALVDEARMRELNRQFAGLDAPTDVLAFADGSPDPEDGQKYLGDVVICLPIAAAQAAAARQTLDAELALLAVHGVLHLVGHDHVRPNQRARMWGAQQRVLEGLGMPAGILP
jgi:probable rRNA maturation factor